MKSIKPGRGPSGMGAVGAIAAALFGLFWTGMAVMMTRGTGVIGLIFPMFGVIFVILGIAQAAYHLKNAKGKDRFSLIDIVDKKEEGDPSDRWISNEMTAEDVTDYDDIDSGQFNYCPYCGFKLDTAYMFCPKCGKSVDK